MKIKILTGTLCDFVGDCFYYGYWHSHAYYGYWYRWGGGAGGQGAAGNADRNGFTLNKEENENEL